MTSQNLREATEVEIDSIAAARELRDSVPADQPRLRRLMDIIVRSFERDRDRDRDRAREREQSAPE